MRPLQRPDSVDLFPSFSSDEQMRWWSRGPFRDVEELADWLCEPNWDGRSWVPVDSADGPALGRFVAMPRGEGVAEIGYLTVAERQGKGVAKECLAALIDYLFRAEGVHRIYADIDPDNAASNRLVESLGFKREGLLRDAMKTHIGWRDSVIWGLLSNEWPN